MNDIDGLLLEVITIPTQASQTTGFTADASISVKKLYPCDATGGSIVVTIPLAATAGNGAVVFIKKTDSSSNAVTPTRSGSDTIDGATSVSMTAENDVYGLVSDGVSRWNIIIEPVNIVDASTSAKGIIEIATDAEFFAGTSTDKAVVPSNIVNSAASRGYIRLGPIIFQWDVT